MKEDRIMFDPNNDRCKICFIAINYVKTRIGDDELKRNCKRICGKDKKKEKKKDNSTELDLFSEVT